VGYFYVLLGLGALVMLSFVIGLARSLMRRNRLPFVAERTLFTPQQLAFKAVLERAVGKDYLVYGRVRAAELVGPRRGLGRRRRERAYRLLGERVFDFVVCTAETSAIGCAVTLAPRSRLRRRPPHDRLDRICQAAGLPLVRFRESDVYSVVEIEEQVFAAMHAVRIQPKAEEPKRKETREALEGLAEVISADDRRNGAAGRRRSERRGEASTSEQDRPPPQVIERPRTEPSLSVVGADHADVDDDGPSFRITATIDDEPDDRRSIPIGGVSSEGLVDPRARAQRK